MKALAKTPNFPKIPLSWGCAGTCCFMGQVLLEDGVSRKSCPAPGHAGLHPHPTRGIQDAWILHLAAPATDHARMTW